MLDVGCGRGVLLYGAAKRLTSGKAVGIDIWNEQDLSGNSIEATHANAVAEGATTHVELIEADFRHMPFAEQSFDIVISSLAIHNVKSVEEREQTLREIIRMLKPNGQFAILDFQHAKQYAAFFQKEGMDDVRLSKQHFTMFPPVRIVSGRKGNAMW